VSSTWKSLTAGFAAGVVSTGLYAFGLHPVGIGLWLASLAYIGYKYLVSAEGMNCG